MDKTLKVFVALLIGVIILIVIVDDMRMKPVNWQPSYSLDKKNPLDLYVFNEQISTFFSQKGVSRTDETSYQYISERKDTVRNYIIIDQSVNIEMDSVLLKALQKGSNLFVSSEYIDIELLDTLGVRFLNYSYDKPIIKDDTLITTLTTSSWKGKSLVLRKSFCESSFVNLNKKTTTILGEMKHSNGDVFPNFIHVQYGKGNIFLHNQPVVFTNFNLLNSPQNSSDYVSHILSYIPKDLHTVWMVKNQTKASISSTNRTPLSVIFKYPSLRAAWLIFLYGLLLFVFFNAKRRQRIVPIINTLRNTTIEFTQTIGNLYLQQENATSITAKKIIYFLDKIRNRYYLETNTLDEEFVKRLHAKSGKDIQLIKEIVYRINKFNKTKYAEQEHLIHFNNIMEKFWEE